MSYASLMLLLLPLQGIMFICLTPLSSAASKAYAPVSGEKTQLSGHTFNQSLEIGRKYIKIGLVFSIQNQLLTLIQQHLYDPNISNFQFQLYLFGKIIGGLDGISQWLIALVNLITPIVILNSWKTIGLDAVSEERVGHNKGGQGNSNQNQNLKIFIILVFLVNFFSVAIFFVLDLLLFYISFEGMDAFNYNLIYSLSVIIVQLTCSGVLGSSVPGSYL